MDEVNYSVPRASLERILTRAKAIANVMVPYSEDRFKMATTAVDSMRKDAEDIIEVLEDYDLEE